MTMSIKRFATDRRGNTIMIFGLSIIPFALMAGAAIDFTRATTTKSALQQATDGAALAVAAKLDPASDVAKLKDRAKLLLQSSNRFANARIVDATLSADKKKFCVTAQVDVPTAVMKLARVDVMSPRTTSCAEFGAGPQSFEIGMALDNSGSMNQSAGGSSKISALKVAATNFVNSMFARAPGKVKIAIAPFAGLVIPVDPSVPANRALPWIDVNGLSSQHWITLGNKGQANAEGFTSRFSIFNNLKTQRPDWDFGGCYEPQTYPMNVTETVPTSGNPETLFVPYFAPDEPDGAGYENNYLNDDGGGCWPGGAFGWNDLIRGCKYKPAPGWSGGAWSWYGSGAGSGWSNGIWGSRGGAFNGPNGMCPNAATQTLLQMTSSQSTLTTKISQLSAGGDTNLHEGFMWAWRAISPNPPFSAGAAYNASTVNKIVVLMTDGYNNWSSNTNTVGGSYYEALGYYSYNGQKNARLPDGSRGNGVDYQHALKAAANTGTDYFSTSRQAQDELTRQSCENAKQAGIEVYTIGFSVSTAPIDAAGIDLLKQCASNADHYFLATNGTELDNAFSKLATNMQKLRLTQ